MTRNIWNVRKRQGTIPPCSVNCCQCSGSPYLLLHPLSVDLSTLLSPFVNLLTTHLVAAINMRQLLSCVFAWAPPITQHHHGMYDKIPATEQSQSHVPPSQKASDSMLIQSACAPITTTTPLLHVSRLGVAPTSICSPICRESTLALTTFMHQKAPATQRLNHGS